MLEAEVPHLGRATYSPKGGEDFPTHLPGDGERRESGTEQGTETAISA